MNKLYPIAIAITIFLLFTVGMSKVGTDIATGEYSNLDDNSILYIAEYNGFREENFNLTEYKENTENINEVTDPNSNETASGKATVDFAQEFLFSQGKSVDSESYISTIVNAPDFYLNTFQADDDDWQDYKIIIAGFIGILIFVVAFYIIKGQLD